jgi:3'-5' exoribonuclease
MKGDGWQWTEYQRHLERYLYLRASGEGMAERLDITEEEFEVESSPSPDRPRVSKVKPDVTQRQRSLF